jgi:hypothetical protein
MDQQVNIETTVSKKKQRRASKKSYGFQCSFCGGHTTNSEKYYSSLAITLLMRLVGLLESSTEPIYQEAMLDAVFAVFGLDNKLMRSELERAGFLDVFDKRHKHKGVEGYLEDGTCRCYKCKEIRYDHEITVDTTSPYFTRYICDYCLEESGDGNG